MTAWYNTGVYGVNHYSAPTVWSISGSIAIQPQFNGTPFAPKNLVGSFNISFAINPATVNRIYSLSGSFNISPIFKGLLNNFNTLGQGHIDIYIPFAGAGAAIGPIWQPDAACTDPGWVQGAPCNG
jgi:hypothetical protein